MLPVSSGVPQGSVLSPLLFLIYANDLAEVVSDVSIKLFADDCVVFKEISSKEDHDVLQNNLLAINDWCDRWGMLLNNEKTVLLRVTRKMHPSNFSYTLQNNVITEVRKYKYLGVTLSSKLNWSDHVSDVCISSLRKLWYLRRKLKDAYGAQCMCSSKIRICFSGLGSLYHKGHFSVRKGAEKSRPIYLREIPQA